MATLPTRTLEIEFDTGVWTAVGSYCVQISTGRGRNRESGAFETGTMSFTLRNDDRRFDPDNAAGTYYGKLRPNRRVRFKATHSAIEYPIYQGFIDRITQEYGGPNDATAVFDCSDMFKILNRVELPGSVYAAEVAADTPSHWWRLDEAAGSTTAVDSIGTLHGTATGVTFGASGLIARDPGTSGQWTGTTSSINATGMTDVVAGAADFSVEAVVKISTLPSDDRILFAIQAKPVDDYLIVTVYGTAAGASAGKLNWILFSSGSGINVGGDSTVSINDGNPHHVAVAVDQGTVGKLYIDGVEAESSAMGTATFPSPMPVFIGNQMSQTTGFPGWIDEVAIFPSYLSSTRVAAHASARSTPWNGDTAGVRINRIATIAGLPAGDLALDAGSTTLETTDLGGSALAYAQKVEETEAGRLFVSRAGKLTFVSRYNGDIGSYLTSKADLTDDDAGAVAPPTVAPYRMVTSDVDEATIVTRATVSRSGGVAVTYKDAAAITEFQILDEVHDGLLHDSDTYSAAYAEWIVNTHKTPTPRVGTVTLELPKDLTNLVPAILALELGDRVTYNRKPQNTGAVITRDMRVEAIRHETGGHYWTTTLQLSPFNLGQGGYGTGVWDTSLWDQAVWGL